MSFWGTILFEYPQPCTFFRSPGVFVGSVGLNFDAETIHAHALQICPLIDTGFKNQAFPSDQFESVNSLILLYIYIYIKICIYIYLHTHMSYDWITTPTIQFQYLDSVSPKINTPLNRGGKIAPSPISSHDGWDHSCAVSFTDCWCQLFACSSISAKCEEDLQMKIHIVHFFGDHYKVVFPSYNYIYIPKKQQLIYKVVPTSYDYILVYDSIYITIDIFRIQALEVFAPT